MNLYLVVMNYNKDKISKNLMERLNQFPLYNNNHWIGVHIDKNIHISYAPTWRRIENIEKTRFDIEIQNDICYILSFNIEHERRKEGNGSLLARIIEEFCYHEFSCKKYITTPSGEGAKKDKSGKCFWEKLGYHYFNGKETEKTLP